jgi:branched-chain amino acid transport system substrate-binding protein
MRKSIIVAVAVAAAGLLGAGSAEAQQSVKIGLMTTLTGPQAILGQHARDAFNLAVKLNGGKLGGVEAKVIIADDELKPDLAVTKIKGLLERDQVDFVTGIIFSNVMMAVAKPIFEANTFLISSNAGPSPLAGKGCSPFFFSTSWQNDQPHEVSGKYAQDKGLKKMFLIAPNYQAGKDALAGFKRFYKGEVVDEVYTQLGQLDFSAELAKIAAAKPEAVYAFMPGGMGVNLAKQYRQAGLAGTTPFLSAFVVDETALPAVQDAALGFFNGAPWAPNLDTPENKTFVAAFEKEYGYVPSLYAAQAYDAALLIDSAVKAVGGNLSNKDAVRAALKKADFKPTRGKLTFSKNGFPVQDFYLAKVVRRPDGKFQTEIAQKVFTNHADAYAAECPLK